MTATIRTASPRRLRRIYDAVANEYAKRLIDQFHLKDSDSWWVSDEPGGVLCIFDCEYSLGMSDVKDLVDHCVSFESFNEWWQTNMRMISERGEDCTAFPINLRSWLRGFRPKE
jgi:hypothetical protein